MLAEGVTCSARPVPHPNLSLLACTVAEVEAKFNIFISSICHSKYVRPSEVVWCWKTHLNLYLFRHPVILSQLARCLVGFDSLYVVFVCGSGMFSSASVTSCSLRRPQSPSSRAV